MALSLRMTISRPAGRNGVVHRLIGHAGRHRPVADHRDDVVALPARSRATAMPSAAEIEVAAWAAPNGIVFALAALGEAGKAAARAQRMDAVAPAGENLVRIGLMADVPDQPIARRIEDIMERDRQFDDAEPGAQMAPGLGQRRSFRL